MLVLTRKHNEKILIGDDIEIMVVDIQAGRVRLGVQAPHSVAIDREEVRRDRLAGKSRRPGKKESSNGA